MLQNTSSSQILPRLLSVRVDMSGSYGRGVLEGIARHALESNLWQLVFDETERLIEDPALRAARVGMVFQFHNEFQEAQLAALGFPGVLVSGFAEQSHYPRVANDDEAIGRMAAEEMLRRGFLHFAWCGLTDVRLSRLRKEAYSRFLSEAGRPVHVLDSLDISESKQYSDWLLALPKPCALFAVNDSRALNLYRVVLALGFRVPDDVAILGVDDDEFSKWMYGQGLSSIRTDARAIGCRAGETLAALLRGDSVPPLQTFAPIGVVTRGSTDIFALEDAVLVKALQCIRQKACSGLGVDDVARQVGVSRRVLEMRFKRELKRSVYGEIIRIRLEQAAHLLRETSLSVEEIAGRVGYVETRQLSSAFRQRYGAAPRDFRRQRLEKIRPFRHIP